MASTSASFAGQVSEAKVEETTMAAAFPNLLDLPTEVTTKILRKVGAVEVLKSAQLVCTQWHRLSMDPLFWRTIHVTTPQKSVDDFVGKHGFYATEAVNRSCRQVEDISIAYPSPTLLLHIADCNLRRLRLERCSPDLDCFYLGLSNGVLIKAAKKLPLLEEIEFLYPDDSLQCLEAIGESCPLLKVLKIIRKRKRMIISGNECDGKAFAIAKTMPNLRHLSLLRNRLTNAGLVAILNGCIHLESLDLRGCLSLNLEEASLWQRCAEQIKQLRLPQEYLAESSDGDIPIRMNLSLPHAAANLDITETESSDFWEEEFLAEFLSIGNEIE
ncbi:hypothetical protein PIB30_004810 [Stylosanthes scabra]|uniref:F-box domain-containing protein n=1 Tax=Stylosanthes scabra TaxID=79078 RepID=A0ABU6T464_9FABA|nr:hypothetical protein [Stylosanthes scabra]